MSRKICRRAPPGYVVYHKKDAGSPELHEGGAWFFEPAEWGGDVYSPGYRTRQAACRAAWSWYESERAEADWRAEQERYRQQLEGDAWAWLQRFGHIAPSVLRMWPRHRRRWITVIRSAAQLGAPIPRAYQTASELDDFLNMAKALYTEYVE